MYSSINHLYYVLINKKIKRIQIDIRSNPKIVLRKNNDILRFRETPNFENKALPKNSIKAESKCIYPIVYSVSISTSEKANDKLAKNAVKIIMAFDVGDACIFLVRPVTNIIGVEIPPPPIPVTPDIDPLRVPMPSGTSFDFGGIFVCSLSWLIKKVRIAK